MCRPKGLRDGRLRSGPALQTQHLPASRRAKRCRVEISTSWCLLRFIRLSFILVPLLRTSMRERVKFPVGLDLPPAMREPVGFEHQKSDDDQPDRDLAQERDVVVERKRVVDR